MLASLSLVQIRIKILCCKFKSEWNHYLTTLQCKHVSNVTVHLLPCTPQSTEVFYLDDGEQKIGPIEKVYVTTLVTPMGLFNYVDGINSKITPKK